VKGEEWRVLVLVVATSHADLSMPESLNSRLLEFLNYFTPK
jgi:hypothetical protein